MALRLRLSGELCAGAVDEQPVGDVLCSSELNEDTLPYPALGQKAWVAGQEITALPGFNT